MNVVVIKPGFFFRCFTRKQNRDYADYLLTALYHESKKAEEWEKQRVSCQYDDLSSLFYLATNR